MATDELNQPPFDWGDSVRIVDSDLTAKCGYSAGSVCGFRVVDQESTAKDFGVQRGSYLVLIELPDGTATEVPSHKVEPMPE